MLKEIDCKLNQRSLLAFIVYILLYAFILAPYFLIGYTLELINYKKNGNYKDYLDSFIKRFHSEEYLLTNSGKLITATKI